MVERILSGYTGDRHACPIKNIPLVIEGNEDNLNIFVVEESTFNSDEVTNMGGNAIATCTREEWLTFNTNIFEIQRSTEKLYLLLEESNSGTNIKMKGINRDVQRLPHALVHRLRIHGGEESSPNDGGRGAVPYVSSFYPNPKKLNIYGINTKW